MNTIYDKLNDVIKDIPERLEDCFVILLGKETYNELIKISHTNYINTFKNIPIIINAEYGISLRVKFEPVKVIRVYLYEMQKVSLFLKELEQICKKYKCNLGGCGCCGSPFISDLYTISVDEINFENDKLTYNIKIDSEYKKILGGDE